MVDVTLIQRYVVARIVRVGLKEGCEFLNHGGKSVGLVDRIMKTFSIPETGHLQQCTDSKTGIHEFEKVRDLIASFIEAKKFEDLVDLYKELFNRDPKQEYTLMDWPAIIDGLLAKTGYVIDLTLRIESKGLHIGYKSVENAFKAACENCEKASTAKDLAHHEKYVDKLGRILDQYPYLQSPFVKQMFGEGYFSQLVHVLDIDQARFNQVKATIKERFMKHTQKEATTIMAEKMKDMHAPAEPYVQFMGTNHLTGQVLKWDNGLSRFANEAKLILKLINEIRAGDVDKIGTLKSVIHRSPHQLRLCREIIIDAEYFPLFNTFDRRKRGMILDEIFDKLANPVKTEVKKEADPMPSFPQYPNLTEEEEPVKDSLYMQLIKTVHPEAYETIKASGDESEENIKAILSHHVKGLGAEPPKSSLKYELPEDKRTGVIIKGNPEDPMVQELAKMFSVDINKVKPVESAEPEKLSPEELLSRIDEMVDMFHNHSSFKSRLTQNLEQRKTGMDLSRLETIAARLDSSFKELTGIDPSTLKDDCQDPDCPAHGEGKSTLIQDLLSRPLRAVDLVVGIEPVQEERVAFINPYLGKARSQESNKLTDLFKFIATHGTPHSTPEPKKPTVSEIETSSKVIINQSFIINDVDDKFFCEYKMIWSPSDTRFMFSHDEPGSDGRQFHHIRELREQMTQDKAFARFQALRRNVITYGSHKPRPNPFTSR